jgi:hypothetical protein
MRASQLRTTVDRRRQAYVRGRFLQQQVTCGAPPTSGVTHPRGGQLYCYTESTSVRQPTSGCGVRACAPTHSRTTAGQHFPRCRSASEGPQPLRHTARKPLPCSSFA